MTTQLLLACLLIADGVLCVAIIVLIVIVNSEVKKRRRGVNENSLMEFRKLLDESQASTNHLLEVMNESRKSLKEIVYVLDEKQEKLKALVEESKIEYEKLRAKDQHTDGDITDKRYDEVITMVKEGLTKKEISQKLELTEGEIDLIIDLDSTRHRVKNENI
jgi:flagellar motility protein MotE (MotC chaperone)